jgi:hypothetical protein
MPDRAAGSRLVLLRALAGGYLVFAATAPLARFPTLCPFRLITGLRCPFCGLTRATRALTRGDIGAALTLHPLAPLLWVAAVIALIPRRDSFST